MITAVVGQAVLGRPMSARQAWEAVKPRLLHALLGVAADVRRLATLLILAVVRRAGSGRRRGRRGSARVSRWPRGGLASRSSRWCGSSSPSCWRAPQRCSRSRASGSRFRRSRVLVAGSWWRVFGIIVLARVHAVRRSSRHPRRAVHGAGLRHDRRSEAATPCTSPAWCSSASGTSWRAPSCGRSRLAIGALLYIDRRMRAEALDLTLQQAAATAAGDSGSRRSPGAGAQRAAQSRAVARRSTTSRATRCPCGLVERSGAGCRRSSTSVGTGSAAGARRWPLVLLAVVVVVGDLATGRPLRRNAGAAGAVLPTGRSGERGRAPRAGRTPRPTRRPRDRRAGADARGGPGARGTRRHRARDPVGPRSRWRARPADRMPLGATGLDRRRGDVQRRGVRREATAGPDELETLRAADRAVTAWAEPGGGRDEHRRRRGAARVGRLCVPPGCRSPSWWRRWHWSRSSPRSAGPGTSRTRPAEHRPRRHPRPRPCCSTRGSLTVGGSRRGGTGVDSAPPAPADGRARRAAAASSDGALARRWPRSTATVLVCRPPQARGSVAYSRCRADAGRRLSTILGPDCALPGRDDGRIDPDLAAISTPTRRGSRPATAPAPTPRCIEGDRGANGGRTSCSGRGRAADATPTSPTQGNAALGARAARRRAAGAVGPAGRAAAAPAPASRPRTVSLLPSRLRWAAGAALIALGRAGAVARPPARPAGRRTAPGRRPRRRDRRGERPAAARRQCPRHGRGRAPRRPGDGSPGVRLDPDVDPACARRCGGRPHRASRRPGPCPAVRCRAA